MEQVLIIAAEASSVTYAERLLEHWKKKGKMIHAFGVGSQKMESLGFERLGKSEEMAVVGLVEVISHYRMLRGVFDQLVEQASLRRPKVAIVMDYPEFNLMLAKKLKKMNIPVVYYISPQIWAWRKGRVKTIKKYCEKVFLLFPFEEKFYAEHQVPHQFIGHPLLDELDDKYFSEEYRKIHRQQYGIQDNEVVLGLMPGSRRLELKQHFEIQLETAKILAKKVDRLKIIIMVAPTFDKDHLLPYLENFRLPYIIIKDEPFHMIHLTDIVLVASGTATLMVGLLLKPMVIMYRMKWITSLLAKMVATVKYFGIVNLILNKEVVPERFQDEANPENLAFLLEKYITDEKYRKQVIEDLKQLRPHLGDKGATQRVAAQLEEYFV